MLLRRPVQTEPDVAILGRPGGRPLQGCNGDLLGIKIVAIFGRPGGRPPARRPLRSVPRRAGCDPRSSRRATATLHDVLFVRPVAVVAILGRPGERPPRLVRARRVDADRVAILGHSEGRPPGAGAQLDMPRCVVAILGHTKGRLPGSRRSQHLPAAGVVILGRPGGRPPARTTHLPVLQLWCRCDPRPPRRTAAT